MYDQQDPQKKEECIKLIKGATKKVIKDQQRLIDKGMNPKALPDVWIDKVNMNNRKKLLLKKRLCEYLHRMNKDREKQDNI